MYGSMQVVARLSSHAKGKSWEQCWEFISWKPMLMLLIKNNILLLVLKQCCNRLLMVQLLKGKKDCLVCSIFFTYLIMTPPPNHKIMQKIFVLLNVLVIPKYIGLMGLVEKWQILYVSRSWKKLKVEAKENFAFWNTNEVITIDNQSWILILVYVI